MNLLRSLLWWRTKSAPVVHLSDPPLPQKPRLRQEGDGWAACLPFDFGYGERWMPVAFADSPQLAWASYILNEPGRTIGQEQLAHYLRDFKPLKPWNGGAFWRRHTSLVQPNDLGVIRPRTDGAVR